MNDHTRGPLRDSASALHDDGLLKALFENGLDAALLGAPGGALLAANPAACALFGRSEAELRRDGAGALADPDEASLTDLERPLAGNVTYRRADGSRFVGATRLHPFRDENGLPRAWILIRPVSDPVQERSAADLPADPRLLRALMDAVPDPLWIKDRESRFVAANHATAHALHARGPEELLGRTDRDFLDPVLAELHEAEERRIVETAEPLVDVELYRPASGDDPEHWLLMSKLPLRDPAGRIVGIVGTSRDVTALKRHERELVRIRRESEQARRMLVQVNRLKTEILMNMSHEVRTPLATILGYSELLKDDLTDQQLQFVRIIELSARRLLTTLTALLDLARLRSERIRPSIRLVNVTAVVREMAGLFEVHAREKGVDLEIRVPDRMVFWSVDVELFKRVLFSLLDNAVKFTEHGRIVVGLDPGPETLRVFVNDTGVGIDRSFIRYLFDPFRQESTGRARRHEGCGIGLSLAKQLLDLMGGRLEVESEKGSGSSFSVILPRSAAS